MSEFMNINSHSNGRDPLSGTVIGCALEVHRALGPGLLESVYEMCMSKELELSGIRFARQRRIPLQYKGLIVGAGFRLDFVIEERLIIKLKAVDRLLPIHDAQLLSYMRLSGIRTGLLINFNTAVLRAGIKRMVL